jgi:hypothetical protein
MEYWPLTAMRMFFDEDRPLAEIFAALHPVGAPPTAIVPAIKSQLWALCADRGELVAQHLKGVIIEIDHEATLWPESSPDMMKYSLQRRVEFVNLLKAALAHS